MVKTCSFLMKAFLIVGEWGGELREAGWKHG